MDVRQNPFKDRGKWYWRDEKDVSHGPYLDQPTAIKDLLKHCGPYESKWQKVRALIKELVAA